MPEKGSHHHRMNFGTLKESPSLRAQLQASEGVYVISNDATNFKVGMATQNKPGQPTRSIYKRLQEFQTCFPRGFKIYNVLVTDDPYNAEQQIHRELVKMGAKRLKLQGLTVQRDSEWFETDQATLERAITRVSKTPGFYAKRIIRLTQRSFHDLQPAAAPPLLRSTINCREIKTTRFKDYVVELPARARQAVRARVEAKCGK